MLEKEIRGKILKIIELVLEINTREKNTIFISFHGHCNVFDIKIYNKGWGNRIEENFFKDIYFDIISEEKAIKELSEIIKELEKLK
jgi:hypothetical protein|nr:MAG TPA: hypothetical protein [Caudoviricetes sp.]